jgi:hypothetical protein
MTPHDIPAEPPDVLEIRVHLQPNEYFSGVTLLVNGDDILQRAGPVRPNYIGYPPADVLVDDSMLLPVDPPRRVGLYRCSCAEGGCGNVTALVTETDTRVRWSAFRKYEGLFDDPVDDDLSDDDVFLASDFRDICFDRDQYYQEVQRAQLAWRTSAR